MNSSFFNTFFIDVKNEDVKHFHVPYYNTLSVKELTNWTGANFSDVAQYFPEFKE
jgi:hypothetical protein